MTLSSPKFAGDLLVRTVKGLIYGVCILMYISCATDGAGNPAVESRRAGAQSEHPEAGETIPSERDGSESVEPAESVETIDPASNEERETVESLDDDLLIEMVAAFVDEVHELIASGEYDEWRALLTTRYIEHYSDDDVLAAVSESPVLKRRGVTLDGLRDYFEHVVRASRTDVDVRAVEVQGENSALALSEVDGEPVVLFNLVRDREHWKIDPY